MVLANPSSQKNTSVWHLVRTMSRHEVSPAELQDSKLKQEQRPDYNEQKAGSITRASDASHAPWAGMKWRQGW